MQRLCSQAARWSLATRRCSSTLSALQRARTRSSSTLFSASAGRMQFHSFTPIRFAESPRPPQQPAPGSTPAASAAPPSSSSSSSAASSSPSASATPGADTSSSKSSSSGSGSTSGSRGGSSGSSSASERLRRRNTTLMQYLLGVGVLVLGAAWAAVPLYRAFCAHTGYGGTTMQDADSSKLAALKPGKREVVISFNADTNPAMHWRFVPSQPRLKVRMGEPVLAFYKATNLRDKAVTGVATYNVTPIKTGAYFHKIQCFCFDEQRLRAKETVDMPVFFYLDPAMEADARCNDVTHITLSYTFFPVDNEEDEETAAELDKTSGLKLHGKGGVPLPPGALDKVGIRVVAPRVDEEH